MGPVAGHHFARRWSGARLAVGLLEGCHYIAGILSILVGGMFVLPALLGLLDRYGQFGALPPDHINRLLFGLFVVAYGVGSCYSASSIGRRLRRGFSLRWAFAHLPTVIWTPLAPLTWLVLTRESVKQVYEDMQLPFTPLLMPPPLPVKAIPLSEDGTVGSEQVGQP